MHAEWSFPHCVSCPAELSIEEASSENVFRLCTVLPSFQSMTSIRVLVYLEDWFRSPGVATSILSLCVLDSKWLSESGRAQGLQVKLEISLGVEEPELEFEHSEEELSALQRSWALTKSVLAHPCRVDLEASTF